MPRTNLTHRQMLDRASRLARPCALPLALLIAVGALAPNAAAQGSADDYKRAQEAPARFRNLVPNEEISGFWIDDDRLIHRVAQPRNTWQFNIIDGTNNRSRAAVDHNHVAAELTRLLNRPVERRKLPIARWAAGEEQSLIFLVEPELRAFQIDADSAITEVPLEDIEAFRLKPSSARGSSNGGPPTRISFTNRTSRDMSIVWVDARGTERRYATVQPGQQWGTGTYEGHLWLVRDDANVVFGRFMATDSPGLVLIDDALPAYRPNASTGPSPRRRTSQESPDGMWRARIRSQNISIESIEDGAIVLTSSNGSERNAYRGPFHWSPDSRFLAVLQTEPAQKHTVSFIENAPDDQLQPKLHQFNYLKPGDRIAHPRVRIFDVETGSRVEFPEDLMPNPWSISDLRWSSDGAEFLFLYNQRGHQALRLFAVDPRNATVRAVINEESNTFVDYSQKRHLTFLDDQSILWMSERSGWSHLYRIDEKTGNVLNAVTQGDWVVRGVERVDHENRQVWFRAMGVDPKQDPYHVHFGRVDFDGNNLVWLTESDGNHRIRFSPSGKYIVDSWSRVDLPPVHELRRTEDGSLVAELSRSNTDRLESRGWNAPERFVAPGRDGETPIWGVIYRPTNFDPEKSYPVIEQIYAGPHGHHVPKSFSSWNGSRSMAELGFIVVRIDGMGTNWRSKAFHDVCWQNIGDAGFPDRIAWMKAAAKDRPWMDLSRVGIFGGSAGGQNALRAMLAHGDFYHAAVADCGCHDNRMDKIWWNEAWMGWPIGDHYEQQSNVTQAHRLEGDLMLIVGELDRNVDPASTMQVVDALIKADKDFDLVFITGAGHGAAGTSYGRRRQADFFVRNLLNQTPRWSGATTHEH